jgi:hypothetical protein
VFVIKVASPLERIKGIKRVKESKKIKRIKVIVRISLTILLLGLEVTIFIRNLLRKFTSRACYAFNYLFRSYKLGCHDNLLVGL